MRCRQNTAIPICVSATRMSSRSLSLLMYSGDPICPEKKKTHYGRFQFWRTLVCAPMTNPFFCHGLLSMRGLWYSSAHALNKSAFRYTCTIIQRLTTTCVCKLPEIRCPDLWMSDAILKCFSLLIERKRPHFVKITTQIHLFSFLTIVSFWQIDTNQLSSGRER